MKNSNRFITVFLAFLLLLTACFPVFGFATQLDDRKNEVSGTQGQDMFQYDHATAEAVPAGESTVSFPSFHVEPVGETTKPVWYGDSILLQVRVFPEQQEELTYSWTQFDREANWWKPIESAGNQDSLQLENVIADAEIKCDVRTQTGYGPSVTYSIRVSKDSEKCGENLEWSLEDGVLLITGTGEMYNYYAQDGFGPPWFNRMNEIQSVVITSGVESVGGYTFTAATNLSQVSFSDTVWIVGDHAFQRSGLIHLYLPDSNHLNVGRYSFEGCPNLQTVSIGKTPEKILEYAFANCPELTTITYRGDYAHSGEDEEFHGLTATIRYPCSLPDPEGIQIICSYSTDCNLSFEEYHSTDSGICPLCGALLYDSVLYLPSSLTAIASEAFSGINATAIVIPDSVGIIESKAFSDNDNLALLYFEGSPFSIAGDIVEKDSITVCCRQDSSAERWAAYKGFPIIYHPITPSVPVDPVPVDPVPVDPIIVEPVPAGRTEFVGEWIDDTGRFSITISYQDEENVKVEIFRADSAFECSRWEMTANNNGSDVLEYEDGCLWIETYTDEEYVTVTQYACDGTGCFFLQDGQLHWHDDQQDEDVVLIPA